MENQNQQTPQPQYQQTVVIVGKQKSVGVAFLLAFLFGPLGLLYASVVGGIVMFFVTGLVAIVTLGLGLLITWPVCIIWAIIAANDANKKMASGSGININTNLGNPPTQQPPITQTVNPQPQVQQQYSQPQAQQQPKSDIGEAASKSINDVGDWLNKNGKLLSEWFNQNKKIVMTVAASVVVLYGVYYFFLKNDPVNDAENAAAAFCECSEKYNDAIIKVDEEFVKSFDTYGFKKRQEARNKLQELQNSANRENSICNSVAQQNYNDFRNRYISEQEMLSKFDFAYNSLSETCNPSNQSKLWSIYSEVENKISSIKDPEPDIEKIKTDLIGQKIPGWNFSYLSEYKSAEILNATRGNDRVEYQIKFHLRDEARNTEHDCEVLSVYLQGDQGWYFNNVLMFYLTYDNEIPSDKWIRITPLQNCTFSVTDDQKLSWKTDNWTAEIKTGPDAPNATLPSSKSYLIRSREGHPVTVKFTYRPVN